MQRTPLYQTCWDSRHYMSIIILIVCSYINNVRRFFTTFFIGSIQKNHKKGQVEKNQLCVRLEVH